MEPSIKGAMPNLEGQNKMGSDNFDKKVVMNLDSKQADFQMRKEAFDVMSCSKPLPCCKGK